MARAKKKDDDEVDFTENGKFKEDAPDPTKGHNIKAMNDAIQKAETEWNKLNDEIQARHDKKKEIFANLKAEFGLTRKRLELGFKRKAMDPDERAKQDELDAVINDALGVPATAIQPDMMGGPDQPINPKAHKEAKQAATVN